MRIRRPLVFPVVVALLIALAPASALAVAAVLRARGEARRLRQNFGIERVYAYGASAGGTLSALLSGDGLVAAAVAKAPVSDLVSWERPARNPLLVYQGRADRVVPPAMNEALAAKYPHVYLWPVPGGHTTDRARPYLIADAMHWLARTAARQARAAARQDALS